MTENKVFGKYLVITHINIVHREGKFSSSNVCYFKDGKLLLQLTPHDEKLYCNGSYTK
jgi:hypothetical protein